MDGQVPGVPEAPQGEPATSDAAPVEPMTQKTKTFLSQRLIILAGAVILLILISGIVVVSRQGIEKGALPTPLPTGGPTPTIQRVEKLPANVSKLPASSMDINGRTVVRTNGVIQSVIKEGESYSVLLDSKNTITAQIGPKTLLGKAWYDVQNGVVVRSSYDIISLDTFVSLAKPQTKVRISYGTEDLKGGQVIVGEFVIAE